MSAGTVTPSGLFAARAAGSKQWFTTLGTSMMPLLLSGDELLVERCAAGQLRAGDVAVIVTGSVVIAHVVSSIVPLRTSSFLGVPDREVGEVLGRALAVKRFGREVPLPRSAVLWGHRLFAQPLFQEIARAGGTFALTIAAPFERVLIGTPQLRGVNAAEVQRAVRLACGILGGSVAAAVIAAGRQGELVVAISRSGLWLGVGWPLPSPTVAVVRWARGFGVEGQLERALS